MSKVDFSEWLAREMEKREWSQSDLARKANINRQVIWTYINKKRTKPDETVLAAIARAFKMPVEMVFRAAGILPPATDIDEEIEQFVEAISKLPREDREDILTFIQMKISRRENK